MDTTFPFEAFKTELVYPSSVIEFGYLFYSLPNGDVEVRSNSVQLDHQVYTREQADRLIHSLKSDSKRTVTDLDPLDYPKVSIINFDEPDIIEVTPNNRVKQDIPAEEPQKKENPKSEPEENNTGPDNTARPDSQDPQTEQQSNRYSDVKENFDNARKADNAGDSELAQKYRAQAWDAFHQIRDEDSKAGVAALGASIAAPFVGAAAVAGGVAGAGTAAGKVVLGFLAKRSVQWTLTGFGVATGVKNDEEADISSVVFEGALRGILPLLSKSFKGPGTYGALAEEPLREADNLLGALNRGNLGSGIEDLDEIAKLWNPIAERMRTLAVIKTDKGIYYAVRGGTLEKEQIKILESFGFKSAKEELKNLGLGVVAKEGHAERQLIDLALAKGEVPQTLLISKAACGRSCHYCAYQINNSGEFGFVPQEFHPSGKAVSFKPSQKY